MSKSPTPPPPNDTDFRQRDSVPSRVKLSSHSQQIVRDEESNVPFVPDDSDMSIRAIDWRARRAMRIAVDDRDAIGHPKTFNQDGSVTPATGIWALLEPLRAMSDDWNEQKKLRSGIAGFFMARGEKVFDRLLLMLVVAVIGYMTRHAWLPLNTSTAPAPQRSAEKP